jgi:hypothetical protein
VRRRLGVSVVITVSYIPPIKGGRAQPSFAGQCNSPGFSLRCAESPLDQWDCERRWCCTAEKMARQKSSAGLLMQGPAPKSDAAAHRAEPLKLPKRLSRSDLVGQFL